MFKYGNTLESNQIAQTERSDQFDDVDTIKTFEDNE